MDRPGVDQSSHGRIFQFDGVRYRLRSKHESTYQEDTKRPISSITTRTTPIQSLTADANSSLLQLERAIMLRSPKITSLGAKSVSLVYRGKKQTQGLDT